MAPAVPFIMMGIAAVSTVAGTYLQYQANQEQKKNYEEAAARQREISERNAQRIEAEGAEEAYRLAEENKRRAALAEARIGASGVSFEGSPSLFMSALKDTGARELAWLRKATSSQAAITRLSGANLAELNLAKAEGAEWDSFGALARGAGGMSSWWSNYGGDIIDATRPKDPVTTYV